MIGVVSTDSLLDVTRPNRAAPPLAHLSRGLRRQRFSKLRVEAHGFVAHDNYFRVALFLLAFTVWTQTPTSRRPKNAPEVEELVYMNARTAEHLQVREPRPNSLMQRSGHPRVFIAVGALSVKDKRKPKTMRCPMVEIAIEAASRDRSLDALDELGIRLACVSVLDLSLPVLVRRVVRGSRAVINIDANTPRASPAALAREVRGVLWEPWGAWVRLVAVGRTVSV
jgi:hypothetical protein